MEINQQTLLTRAVVSALFIAVIAGAWDAWWHGVVGRESFWSPPHLLLYASVISAIGAGVYGWRRTKEKVWRRLTIILTFVPLSAPFDEAWHRLFGVEDISSPLIVWSPPHLLLIGAIAASFAALLPLLRKDKDLLAQQFFGALALSGILSLLLFVASPVQPTGPHELIGFWGAGILALIFAGIFLAASLWMPGPARALLVAAFSLLLNAISFVRENLSPDVAIKPHDHPPFWLLAFSVLIFAIIIDATKRQPLWLRGSLGALAWGALLYGFSSTFFKPEFQYTLSDTATAVFASIIGGVVAGLFLLFVLKTFYRKLLED